MRISLDEDDFRELVRGEIVRKNGPRGTVIEVALRDIGWNAMSEALIEAMREGTGRLKGPVC